MWHSILVYTVSKCEMGSQKAIDEAYWSVMGGNTIGRSELNVNERRYDDKTEMLERREGTRVVPLSLKDPRVPRWSGGGVD